MENNWFEYEQLAQHPGVIAQLIDQEFEVVRPWRDLGLIGGNGRPVLLPWQIGTKGIVSHIQYDRPRGWEVCIQYIGPGRSLSLSEDEYWTEVSLRDFLHSCAPIGGAVMPDPSREAANDD